MFFKAKFVSTSSSSVTISISYQILNDETAKLYPPKKDEHEANEQEATTSSTTPDPNPEMNPPPQYTLANPYLPTTSPSHLEPPLTPYRPFPPKMHIKYTHRLRLPHFKTLKICDPSSRNRDPIFAISAHHGLTSHKLLGTKQGFVLHNGPSYKSPVLAATASTSRHPVVNSESLVWVPAANSRDFEGEVFEVETMRVLPSGGEGVVLGFAVCTAVDRVEGGSRERFEWRGIVVAVGSGEWEWEGFRLVRMIVLPDGKGEAEEEVALLKWPVTGRGERTRAFELELKGSALDGVMGERAKLVILITAVSIYMMRSVGQVTRTSVGAAEVLHADQGDVKMGEW